MPTQGVHRTILPLHAPQALPPTYCKKHLSGQLHREGGAAAQVLRLVLLDRYADFARDCTHELFLEGLLGEKNTSSWTLAPASGHLSSTLER